MHEPGPRLVAKPEGAQSALSVDAELREFLEEAAIGMQWLAPDGTILWANKTELGLMGYERQEYVGRRFTEFAAEPEVVEEALRRLRQGETVCGYELEVRCGGDRMRWVRLDANPWAREGHLLHARCFMLDITEKKKADEAQMRLAAIVQSSDDAIASKDLNGIVTSWNRAAERILGYTAEEMIGHSILKIIPPELHGDEPEILRKIRSGERIEHFETIRVTKGGERINVSLTISPVRNQEGRIIGAAKILRDVTAQKKLEATLRTTERLASVGRLAATVAHEINNPLEAVTNLIYLARLDAGTPEGVRNCLIAADDELQRVSHIARQTLGFYRDTSSPVLIRVSEAIDEVLVIYERRLSYKNITIRKQVKPELTVCALMGEFKQILSNLISNAIDASRNGTEIRLGAWEGRHPVSGIRGIRLVVADRGVGVPKASLGKIFTPFFTTKKDFGTGLGLWITRDLLEKKGGSIRCRSRVGEPGDERSGTIMMGFLPTATRATCEPQR